MFQNSGDWFQGPSFVLLYLGGWLDVRAEFVLSCLISFFFFFANNYDLMCKLKCQQFGRVRFVCLIKPLDSEIKPSRYRDPGKKFKIRYALKHIFNILTCFGFFKPSLDHNPVSSCLFSVAFLFSPNDSLFGSTPKVLLIGRLSLFWWVPVNCGLRQSDRHSSFEIKGLCVEQPRFNTK